MRGFDPFAPKSYTLVSVDEGTHERRRTVVTLIENYEAAMEYSSLLHPVNATEQREQFLAGSIEEPAFVYRECALPTVAFPSFEASDELGALYHDRMEYTIGLRRLLATIGNDEAFTEASMQVFAVQKRRNLDGAAVQSRTQDGNRMNAEEIAQHFRVALVDCGLKTWTVRNSPDISSRMMVNIFAREVVVRSDLTLIENEVEQLTRHEIGVHVLRAVNGRRQSEPLLHVGTRMGRLIEEGVATYMEEAAGPPRIFLRHHAVCYALEHSFRATWNELQRLGCAPIAAWRHTLRVKRGLRSGASHGAFTKDAMYAQGFDEIQEYVGGGGSMAPLLSASVHFSEIPLLRQQSSFTIFPVPDFIGRMVR